MILRELLATYGIRTITEFARRAQMSKAQAWSLWHGRAQLGMQLSKQLSQRISIPLTRFVELDPTPRTPSRGKGGRHQPAEPPGEAQRE